MKLTRLIPYFLSAFFRLIISLLLFSAGIASARAGNLKILYPLYAYPNWYDGAAAYIWDDIAAANATVSITAIINPNSGPNGGPPNTDFQHGMNDLKTAGVTMIGYVHTSYGARALADVEAEIDIYDQSFSSYGLSGIFLDEASNDPAKLSYYQTLYNYIHAKPHLTSVITNPGTQIPEAFVKAPTSDSTAIFEDTNGWMTYKPDAYVANYPRLRFAAVMLNIPTAAQMRSAVDLAAQRNVGYVFVTDDTTPNPYDTLPSYWKEEVNYVASVPEPDVGALLTLSGGVIALLFVTQRRRWLTSLFSK